MRGWWIVKWIFPWSRGWSVWFCRLSSKAYFSKLFFFLFLFFFKRWIGSCGLAPALGGLVDLGGAEEGMRLLLLLRLRLTNVFVRGLNKKKTE